MNEQSRGPGCWVHACACVCVNVIVFSYAPCMNIYSEFLLMKVLYISQAQENFGMTPRKLLYKIEILRLERTLSHWRERDTPAPLVSFSAPWGKKS